MRTGVGEPAAFWTSALSPISPCQTYLMWPVMMLQVPVLSSIPAPHWSERAPERIEWKHTPSDVSNRSQLVNFMQSALVTRFLSSAESIGSHDRWFPGLRSQRWQNSRLSAVLWSLSPFLRMTWNDSCTAEPPAPLFASPVTCSSDRRADGESVVMHRSQGPQQ